MSVSHKLLLVMAAEKPCIKTFWVARTSEGGLRWVGTITMAICNTYGRGCCSTTTLNPNESFGAYEPFCW